MVYLDWAATALPDSGVVSIMAEATLSCPGNPSSLHPLGKESSKKLEEARIRCSRVLKCNPERLAFTSGGTESNFIVLLSLLNVREPGEILLSGMEHASVLEASRSLKPFGWHVKTITPPPDGRLHPEMLSEVLKRNPKVRMVSIMGVNNETGVIQPINELAAAVRSLEGRPILFHSDMVQAVGKIPVDLSSLDIDFASISGHKIRAPRGIGLLYHKNPDFKPFSRGGGQEHGVRSGTENVAGAIALASALERFGHPQKDVDGLGRALIQRLNQIKDVHIIPKARLENPDSYVSGIVSLTIPPIPSEVLVRVLGSRGYAVSTGSACRSNRKVHDTGGGAVKAMNLSKEMESGVIRVSIGSETKKSDVDGFAKTLEAEAQALKKTLRPA